jgi:hypothetical protein
VSLEKLVNFSGRKVSQYLNTVLNKQYLVVKPSRFPEDPPIAQAIKDFFKDLHLLLAILKPN